MRTWLSRTAPGWGLLLAALAVLATAGCTSDGRLHDAGRTRAVTSWPTPRLLWPAADTAPPSTATATGQPPPAPVPGVPVEGDDIRAVEVGTLLAHDPAVLGPERSALAGCAGCAVRPAQYRDLTGDGRDELLTAVITGDRRAVLHVYTLRERQILPVLALQALPGFSADTVGTDLLVHEPTSEVTETTSTYHWDSVRLAFDNRQIRATGPAADVPGCEPAVPNAEPVRPGGRSPAPGSGAAPAPTAPNAPSAAPTAPNAPSAAPRATVARRS